MSIKITWGSHACFIIEYKDFKIAADPFITDNPLTPFKPGAVRPDYIIVTHGHGDHVGDAVDMGKKGNCIVISGYEVCCWLSGKGVKHIHPIQIGGRRKFPWGEIKMTQAFHSSSMPDGSYGGNPAGFILYMDGKKIYHAGDTGLFGDMGLIGDEGIDLALLPIGDNFTMGPEDALKALKLIKPKYVIPIHYNTFELIKQNPKPWVEVVAKKTKTKPVLLKPGETFEL